MWFSKAVQRTRYPGDWHLNVTDELYSVTGCHLIPASIQRQIPAAAKSSARLPLMESQVPGSVVAIMTPPSKALGSEMSRWGWMLIERCDEEPWMSRMSEICSLFSGLPTERELKWSFWNYFQKNRIIIITCENRPMKGVRTCSKWFRVISYMFL